MRADRLIALLMLLQARGQMTAAALAAELEVSERTIYRDIDALSLAGIPLYAETGPHGGYALLDSYRTTLTGLTRDEIRALFMLSIPEPLAELGMDQDVRAALRKLAAALPPGRRQDETFVRRRFLVDTTWWDRGPTPAPHLKTVQEAVESDCRLRVTYRTWAGPVLEQTVAPYALVAKAGAWHLVYVYKGRVRVLPVADLLDVNLQAEPFVRPDDFDLVAFWRTWCAHRGEGSFRVTALVAPDFVAVLPHYLGDALPDAEAEDAAGGEWIRVTLSFRSLEEARGRLLACGCGVEVLEPRALRASVADHAEQIARLYGGTVSQFNSPANLGGSR